MNFGVIAQKLDVRAARPVVTTRTDVSNNSARDNARKASQFGVTRLVR